MNGLEREVEKQRLSLVVLVDYISRQGGKIVLKCKERKGNALFNDVLNTFYLRLYGVGYVNTILITLYKERKRKEGNVYLTMHSTHFIHG